LSLVLILRKETQNSGFESVIHNVIALLLRRIV